MLLIKKYPKDLLNCSNCGVVNIVHGTMSIISFCESAFDHYVQCTHCICMLSTVLTVCIRTVGCKRLSSAFLNCF